MNCPCQSGYQLENCCGRFISHREQVQNALQLMRSRYTAYVLEDVAYLKETWHDDYRPEPLALSAGIRWLGLEIFDFSEQDGQATVEFEARLLAEGKVDGLHENSRFVWQQQRWLYTDGQLLALTFAPWQPGRNEACPCGSGLKFKRCCAV